ncbi:peptidoglycan-binding protein [Rubellimicrobium rubrum]|uniref:Peptidoglycan-binding protein n=1 Tax=Rubellimicrobium rubrum TaxID=2585369 RepID=A0A5C4MT67_9RHOB|nr:peptidoglycan-binding domain-containing protein [Rubellimicrobium rubrum]TNC48791.1 peptidoglycan-binding protein [Rubellimicrobium rubrum]
MRHLLIASALAALLPGVALADDLALVLGTADYATLPDFPRGAEVTDAVDGLATLGFRVMALRNGGAAGVTRTLNDFMAAVPEADRILIALSGRFVTDGRRTWYLTRDAAAPTLFGLDERALSLESLMQVLARAPSRAVLLLGVGTSAEQEVFDPWLREGVGDLDIPQGVTVLTAGPRNAANFLADELSVPRGDLSRLVAENGNVDAEGYLPRGFVFTPRPGDPALTETQAARAEETALWQGAVALNTIDAYRNYLSAFPRGRYAAQAQEGIDAILAEPNREQRLAEEALGLSRDQRREIQRNLSLLDFDTRGIDGIFGSGTRRAVTDWQQQNGFSQTSYLDREQIERIAAQAGRRAQQLEAEAERQRQEAERADRAFWEESGARADEAGLRAYLERYPDGLFAQQASEQLARIEGEKRQEAQAQDRVAWDRAREADTLAGYQRYLESFPQGQFVEEARTRRNALVEENEGAQETEEARAAEQALGLNALTARVIEQRLDALGLNPGEVDGRFDRNTRRALRNYQRDRGLPVSGFLNEPTLVRLLADTLGQSLQE